MVSFLVSVIVITFNSSKYIIETLESIKRQSYLELELIVTDDASNDDTLQVVQKWTESNKDRFNRVEIVRSETNTGITPNINRGIKSAKGVYIKLIAGDDLLLETCIEESVRYCNERNLDFAFSKVLPFIDAKDDRKLEVKLRYEKEKNDRIFKLPNKKQYKKILGGFSLYINGLVFKASFIENIGLFDEAYEMMEDYPFVLKISSMGYKMELIGLELVKYRVRSPDTSKNIKKTRRYILHMKNLSDFEKKEIIPRVKKEKMYLTLLDIYIRRLERKIISSTDNNLVEKLGRLVGYFSILKIADRIKKQYYVIKNKEKCDE